MKNSKETVFLPFSTDKGIILEGLAHILELGRRNLGKCWCRPRNFSLFPSRRCCRISSFYSFVDINYPLKEKCKSKTSISVQNPKMSQMSQTPLTMLWKSTLNQTNHTFCLLPDNYTKCPLFFLYQQNGGGMKFSLLFSVDIETSEMPKECNDGGKFDIVFKTID